MNSPDEEMITLYNIGAYVHEMLGLYPGVDRSVVHRLGKKEP